jgi:hypothetical protein
MSWDQTAPDELTTWNPSADLSAALPKATCSVHVTDEAGQPSTRRIRLVITWPNTVGQPIESSLTIWRFAPEDRP